ncbi:hypothetical protein MTR67_049704 [Solanum verrucosum]|uniref:Uncharacterized protein n=1 Tax=Solanum verrucosum TaxID=315347 RepID=A0AAF0V310_SOLVR|nr:hypothetical protein MTR67_049704 [Solanum verrucosum]
MITSSGQKILGEVLELLEMRFASYQKNQLQLCIFLLSSGYSRFTSRKHDVVSRPGPGWTPVQNVPTARSNTNRYCLASLCNAKFIKEF